MARARNRRSPARPAARVDPTARYVSAASKIPWTPTALVPLASGSLVINARRGDRPNPRRLREELQADRIRNPRMIDGPANPYAMSGGSLTAAATPITKAPSRDRISRTRTSTAAQEWQTEVMHASRLIGELRYIAGTTANAASRGWIYPVANEGKVSALGAKTSANEDQESSERGAPEGTVDSEIVRRIVQLLGLIGEAYLCELPRKRGRPAAGAPVVETHIKAPMDVKFTGDDEVEIDDVKYPLVGPGRIKITRIHRPDPFNSNDPDSPARSALPVLREIIGLGQHVAATMDSRSAGAGVMRYPIEAEVMRPTGAPGGIAPTFADALTEAMVESVSDRDAASAVVPVLLGVPSDVPKEALEWVIPPGTTLDAQVTPMRSENIRRLALAMDAPPEVLLGASGLSHFSAWSVDGEFIRLQIAPMLRLVAQAFTVAYGTEYTFSTSPLTVRPNLALEAQALYDRGVIGDAALRAANGFSDEDAPTYASKDEEALSMARAMVKGSPSLLAAPGLPAVLDQCRIVLGLAPKHSKYYPSAEATPASPVADPREPDPGNQPTSTRPKSDGSPSGGADGKPHKVPGTT